MRLTGPVLGVDVRPYRQDGVEKTFTTVRVLDVDEVVEVSWDDKTPAPSIGSTVDLRVAPAVRAASKDGKYPARLAVYHKPEAVQTSPPVADPSRK